MTEELERLRKQAADDRKLFERAAQALAEIDRAQGLSDLHADVLAALRIRLEGRARASLDELLTVTGDISGSKDLGEVLGAVDKGSDAPWPEVRDDKKEWPGLSPSS
ncbi:MAG: hypothetical protein ABR575_02550 [Actinomycetota bacterium]